MKTFRQLIKEVAEPRGGDERRFKNLHVDAIDVIDYPIPGNEHVFKGNIVSAPRLADIADPDDEHYDQSYVDRSNDGKVTRDIEDESSDDDEEEDDEDDVEESIISRAEKVKRSRYREVGESTELIEAIKPGTVQLSDGTKQKITKEDADVLNSLFTQLNSQNRSKMEQRLTGSKGGFVEVLQFAKTL